MSSVLGALAVVLCSVLAGAWAAEWSGIELTQPVWAVLLVQALLLAVFMLQSGRYMRQLRDRTAIATFSRDSADILTRQRSPDRVLDAAARLLAGFLGTRVYVLLPNGDGTHRQAAFADTDAASDAANRSAWADQKPRLQFAKEASRVAPVLSGGVPDHTGHHDTQAREQPLADAIRWSADNARPVGPGSGNWDEFPFWYVPFSRLPGEQPVLVVEVGAQRPQSDMLSFLRGFTDLLAASHDRLQSLRRANEAELSAERQRLQNRFLASISHDMRTPLTGILGASSTLLEQGEQLSPPEQRHLLEGLHRQVRYLADTTDNILSLLRLQQSAPEDVVTDWESPEELLGLVLARFPQATAEGRLLAKAETVELLVKANATLIVQALVNLVDNALRLNASFEPVCIQLRCDSSRVDFVVTDRGPGFSAGFDIQQTSRPLRTDQTQPATGSGAGLGLSIVQAIARAHGAWLSAVNRSGGGAEVVLGLAGTPWEADNHG